MATVSRITKSKAAVGKRQAKATSAQIDFMVDYFVQHPHVATGKFKTLHGKADLSASWDKLVDELNQMSKDGKSKDMKSWKSTWRDNKTMVSQKIAKIRANRAATGNVGEPPANLSGREQKILGLMGFDYVEGVQCPDAFPEEQLNSFELLAEGQEDVLNSAANNLTVRSCSDVSCTAYTNYEMLDGLEGIESTATEPYFMRENSETVVDPLERRKSVPTASEIIAATSSEPISSGVRNSNRQERASKVARRNGDRLSTHLQNARTYFATLAERQISCMEMFAKAMQQIADNDKQRNEILRSFAEAQKARDQTFSELVVLIKDCVNVLKKTVTTDLICRVRM